MDTMKTFVVLVAMVLNGCYLSTAPLSDLLAEDPDGDADADADVDSDGDVDSDSDSDSGADSGDIDVLDCEAELWVRLSADAPVNGTLIMGALDKEVARFRLDTLPGEDEMIDTIRVGFNLLTNRGTIRNIRLFDLEHGEQLGHAVVWLNERNEAIFENLLYVVPANYHAVFRVVLDVVSWEDGGIQGAEFQPVLRADTLDNPNGSILAKLLAEDGTTRELLDGCVHYRDSSDWSRADEDVLANVFTISRN